MLNMVVDIPNRENRELKPADGAAFSLFCLWNKELLFNLLMF
jgi:hypothetical protein